MIELIHDVKVNEKIRAMKNIMIGCGIGEFLSISDIAEHTQCKFNVKEIIKIRQCFRVIDTYSHHIHAYVSYDLLDKFLQSEGMSLFHCLSDDGGGEYGIKVCGVRIYPEDFYTYSNVCVFVMPRFVKYAWISDSKVAPIVKSPEYIIVRSYEQG